MRMSGISRDWMGKGGNYKEWVTGNPYCHAGVLVVFFCKTAAVCRQMRLPRQLLWKRELG